jgi:outer membrane cobalamin receptor
MKTILSAAVCGVLASFSMTAQAGESAAEKKVELAIERQSLVDALDEWAKQTGLQFISPSSEILNATLVPPIKGSYTAGGALEELLKGTSLTYVWISERTVAIKDKVQVLPAALRKSSADTESVLQLGGLNDGMTRVAAADPQGRASDTSSSPTNLSARDAATLELEEIIVTGSHIRGKAQSSSPLLTITRDEIARTGYTTVAELMATVPQNFAGVAAGTNEQRATDAGNGSYGTAVDLRGLGADATLILVNGHRLAPSGYYGAFSDVSVIPLSAVERVEILADGASAIYGSDAIGGVVNYILTEDFSGAETSASFGNSADGDPQQYSISQVLGTTWDSGHALLSYEYHEQDELRASDRDYAAAAEPAFLLPSSDQHSAFLSASQEITSAWTLRGDGLYSERGMDFQASIAGTPFPIDARTKQYSATVENEIQLAGSWRSTIAATHGGNDSFTANAFGRADSEARLTTFDVMADGAVLSLAGGEVLAAVGGQYRDEKFDRLFAGSFASAGPDISADRYVYAAFAELSVPIVGASNSRPGIERLAFDLAARYEEYSDFGSTTDPKFGFVWAPTSALQFRGTVSSSFKAPNFQQLMGGGFALLENSPDPLSPTGESVVLLLIGENPGLDPQRSTQWTAGLDLTPSSLPGFRTQLTYFDIHFKDRLTSPDLPILQGTSQAERDAAFIHRNPSPAEVAAFVEAVGPTNFTDVTAFIGPQRQLSDVTAIADSRTQNIAVADMRGIDLLASYRGRAATVSYEFGISGTYLLDFENVPRPGFEAVDELNQLGHPIDLRLRATGTLSRGGASATLSVNHQGGYSDETGETPVAIDSWTTVDLQLHYQTSGAPANGGWDFALSVLNLLDKDPPRVVSSTLFSPVGYDSANANPLGRTILARVQKSW